MRLRNNNATSTISNSSIVAANSNGISLRQTINGGIFRKTVIFSSTLLLLALSSESMYKVNGKINKNVLTQVIGCQKSGGQLIKVNNILKAGSSTRSNTMRTVCLN